MNTSAVLLENACLITLDPERRVIADGHLLVENGRIAALGPGRHPAPVPGAEVRDLGGQIVMPGLIDAHYHSYGNLLKGHIEAAPLEAYVMYVIAEGPRLSADDVEVSSALGALELLASGCTACLDHLSQPAEALARAARVYRRLGLRCMLTPQFSDRPYAATLPAGFPVPSSAAGPVAGGPGLPAAGSLEPLEEVIRRCHRPADGVTVALGPSGPLRCSDELLVATADLARRHGLQWHTHLLESRPQEVAAQQQYGRSMVEHLEALGLLGPHASLAHAIWTSASDLDRIATNGAAVVHVPVANLHLGDGIMPFVEMRRRGITVALGTDNSACAGCQSMFEAMKLAALLGRVIEPDATSWPTSADALEAATLGGARVLGLAAEVGSLEVGKWADLVFLRRDVPALTPLHNPSWQIVFGRPEHAVVEVWTSGRPVIRAGRLTGTDQEALLAEAAGRGAHLLRRCREAYSEIQQHAPRFAELVAKTWGHPTAAVAGRWHPCGTWESRTGDGRPRSDADPQGPSPPTGA